MMRHKPITTEAAEKLKDRMRKIAKRSTEKRLALLERAFPTLVSDARSFYKETWGLPWTYAGHFLPASKRLKQLLATYQVRHSNERPLPEAVLPLTDLFYEAAVLVYELEEITWEARRTSCNANLPDVSRYRLR